MNHKPINPEDLIGIIHEEMIAQFEKERPGFKEGYERESEKLNKKMKCSICKNSNHLYKLLYAKGETYCYLCMFQYVINSDESYKDKVQSLKSFYGNLSHLVINALDYSVIKIK